jgi:hypothetical protein
VGERDVVDVHGGGSAAADIAASPGAILSASDRSVVTISDETVRLSTGREVDLPFRCEADVAGALFSADWDALRRAVPDELTPVRLGPRSGGVVVAGLSYSQAGGFEPYDELAVVVPVARHAVAGVPRLDGGVGGYVVALPVTTETSCHLGREIWGFPKTVADVEVRREGVEGDGAAEWHVDVHEDGERALSLTVRETRRHSRDVTLDAYTRKDGQLWRTPVEIVGPAGFGIGLGRVELDVGTGPLAADVRRLGVHRPVGRFTGRLRAQLAVGEAAAETDYHV